jgi:hypothetical protein
MQCQAYRKFLDPLTAHAGYEKYLNKRVTKAQRARKDWRKCMRAATHGDLCKQHAALQMIEDLYRQKTAGDFPLDPDRITSCT